MLMKQNFIPDNHFDKMAIIVIYLYAAVHTFNRYYCCKDKK